MYVIGPLVFPELVRRGIITWPWYLALALGVTLAALLIGRYVVIPRLARMESADPRISRTATWESELAPAQALALMDRALRGEDTKVTVTADTLHLRAGSDEVYRVKGSASDEGWAALPLAATFRVEPRGSGSRIHAEVRDDLGWYMSSPQPYVEIEVRRRGAALIRRARAATEAPTTDG